MGANRMLGEFANDTPNSGTQCARPRSAIASGPPERQYAASRTSGARVTDGDSLQGKASSIDTPEEETWLTSSRGASDSSQALVQELLARRDAVVYFLIGEKGASRRSRRFFHIGEPTKSLATRHGDLTHPILGVSKADQRRSMAPSAFSSILAAVYDLRRARRSYLNHSRAPSMPSRGQRHPRRMLRSQSARRRGRITKACSARTCSTGEKPRASVLPDQHDVGSDREQGSNPVRVLSPCLVVAQQDRRDGARIDGPTLLQADPADAPVLPPWMPTIGIEGGPLNIVPVRLLWSMLSIHIAHRQGLDGRHSTRLSGADACRRCGQRVVAIAAHRGLHDVGSMLRCSDSCHAS